MRMRCETEEAFLKQFPPVESREEFCFDSPKHAGLLQKVKSKGLKIIPVHRSNQTLQKLEIAD